MNLFVSDLDPCQAARNLDDKRVNKMILETAQMLCCALHARGIAALYKPTHQRHPVTLWIARSPANGAWAHRHGLALCDVYTAAQGRVHATEAVLRTIAPYFASDEFPSDWQNSARNDQVDFSHLPIVEAYRKYLLCRWATDKLPKVWTNRPIPEWAIQKGERK